MTSFRGALSFQNYITTMRTPSVILTTVTVALFSSASPACARYTEQWMSSAEIAHTQPKSAAPQKSKKAAHKAPVQTAVTTADDDPIAAFARKPVRH
jgi:hypothetical protein